MEQWKELDQLIGLALVQLMIKKINYIQKYFLINNNKILFFKKFLVKINNNLIIVLDLLQMTKTY